MSWLSTNWLALYGAVIGTAASVVAGLTYWHNVKKEHIQLELSCQIDQRYVELSTRGYSTAGGRHGLIAMYHLTVRNIGSVNAPLSAAGIVDTKGNKHDALEIHMAGSMSRVVSPFFNFVLQPHTTKTFDVYHRVREGPFTAVKAYVVDGTCKEWRARVR